MKIKTSSTPFVFNRYAVRIPLHRITPELHSIDTPFVPMTTFDRYTVRTPSIYTREVGSSTGNPPMWVQNMEHREGGG